MCFPVREWMESNLIHEEQEKKVVKDLHNSIIQKEALIPTSISQTTQLARSGKKKIIHSDSLISIQLIKREQLKHLWYGMWTGVPHLHWVLRIARTWQPINQKQAHSSEWGDAKGRNRGNSLTLIPQFPFKRCMNWRRQLKPYALLLHFRRELCFLLWELSCEVSA